MIYLDKPYVLLQWDAKNHWVEIQWRSYVAGEEYRAVLNKELEALILHGSTKLLCDLRKMTVMTADDQAWVDAEFMPKMIRTSRLKYCSIVIPTSALAHMSLKHIVSKTSPSIQRSVESAYFDNVEHAKAWLCSPGPLG